MLPSIKKYLRFLKNIQVYLLNLPFKIDVAVKLLKMHENEANPILKEHLRALQKEDSEKPTLTYGFDVTARKLEVVIPRETTQRSTVICTVALGETYRNQVKDCLLSQKLYAEKMGFDYVQLTQSPNQQQREAPWYKIALIYRLFLAGYKHVVFIDADAMVMNLEYSFELLLKSLESSGEFIILTEDEFSLNTGVMLLKNSYATWRLLDLIWNNDVKFGIHNWEQDALIDLLNRYVEVRRLLRILENAREINSFPAERAALFNVAQKNNFEPGDFICHFSGFRGSLLEKINKDYARKYKRRA